MAYSLKKQPRSNGTVQGVSFFVPSANIDILAVHKKLGCPPFMCMVTVPNTPLPPTLQFVNDGPLQLRLEDDELVCCGQHWSLYTCEDCSAEAFEAAYKEIMNKCIPCTISGHAEPQGLPAIDYDYMPSDKLSRVAAMALDVLAEMSDDPNIRQFSWLFANHLRATE